MALTSLPEEVLELIVNKLSARDLIACSAVSIDWRLKFNEDVFWKKFCFQGIKDYLEEIPSEVEPTFEYPESREYRLQPVCDWRVHYMRNVHLYGNWKTNRYSLTKIRQYADVLSCEVKIDSAGVHWLFVTTDSEIEVWNVNSAPEYFASVPLLTCNPNPNLFVTGKILVVTQWNISSVYDLQSFKTCFRFAIEEDNVLPENLLTTGNKNEINFINEEDDFRFTCFGSVFAGFKRIPNPPTDFTMYLWDLLSGKKLRTVSMTHSITGGTEISFTNIFKIESSKGLIRHAFRSLNKELCSKLFVYDFNKLKYSELNISVPGAVVWCGYSQNVIIAFTSPGIIRFYNYSTGKLISLKEVGQYTNTEQMELVGSHLMYCMFNCMNVMDIHKQEIVYCLEFSFHSFVRHLTIIKPRFVVVWLLDRGGSPGCPSYSQEVWDLKDLSSKLLYCSSELGKEMVASSPSLVKQVVSHDGMLYLYTFW